MRFSENVIKHKDLFELKIKMCQTYSPNCSRCPLDSPNNGTKYPCYLIMHERIGTAEFILKKWEEQQKIEEAEKYLEDSKKHFIQNVISKIKSWLNRRNDKQC